MMFIPILLMLLSPCVLADLMPHPEDPRFVPETRKSESVPETPDVVPGERNTEPEIKLRPRESVKVSTDGERESPVQTLNEFRLEERSSPGKVATNCLDCAITHLPEVAFSVKVPKLNINFEVSDFPSSRLIFASLASRIKDLPFVRSLRYPTDHQRIQLRSIGDVEVHIHIPKFGWKQVLKMSDVISGFELPKIPTIAPKVESCVGECLTH
ncbi:p2b protein [Blackberry chlorotic ringspot virus]|uniref:p2b protein n=1 Tax=Blackberry chlorotic ringspot virus TaxID=339420 RepID=A9CB81_9BROM|nr:p2b protein [Blackberry chlorotic ringspot virus]ABW34639.1 p2b protein [Blackberry chlorotic ringspot virus]